MDNSSASSGVRPVEPGLAGLVLAGGQSSRMGEDKALMVWRGATLLDGARSLLRRAGCDDVRIVGRPGEPDGMADDDPGSGPARAVLSAARRLSGAGQVRRVLVVPVDMPLLEATDLVRLLDCETTAGCHYAGYPLPFVARCEALATVPEETRSVRGVLTALGAREVAMPTGRGRAFSNINTLEDFARLGE